MSEATSSDNDIVLPSTTPSSIDGTKDSLRVIISGGSIAGLTLAHCLHHNNIDFVVLEARNEIAPQVGASIVVLPNGARILDQLGIFDDMFADMELFQRGFAWTKDGKPIWASDGLNLIEKRMGYPVALLQRRDLLKVLYSSIKDKSKVHTSKRVCKVDHSDSGVVVHCEDGSTYLGDIVVGADGIHSKVRALMLEHIEKLKPGATEKDNTGVSAEYNCIFGFGDPIDGVVHVGDTHRTYAKDHSTLLSVGKGGKLYWSMISKLDKRYFGKDIPRYTEADMEEASKSFYNMHMTHTITYDKVWKQRTFANMCALEESVNEYWTAGRFVCLGDAIHKMTPN